MRIAIKNTLSSAQAFAFPYMKKGRAAALRKRKDGRWEVRVAARRS